LNNDRGSVLILTLSGTNGEKLCDYLNKLSDVYALYSLDLKNSASSNAIHFIDSQLDYITESLHVTGNRLQDFRTSERVLDLSQESTGLYSLVNELNTEKARLSINRTYYEYLKKYFEDKQSNSDIIAPSVVGIGDKLLDEMVAAVNRLIIKKRELSADNMESNPILRNIDNQLESQRKDIIENLNNLIVVNDIALKNTALRADSAEREIQRLPFTERQLANIKREYAISDNIYTFLLQKRAETSITLASNSADNRVLDKALAEDVKSISPRYSTNYFIAVVAGTLIPLIIILVNESLSNKIKSLQEIESLTSIPIAGKIGHNNNIEPVPVMSHSKSQLAESFRSLRSNLQYFGLGSNNHILSVTSTVSGEGKTFCAVNLAASMAMTGRRVLLVSLDLRRPKIHHIFNLKNDTGLSNYLAGLCTVDEVISATNYPNLSVALSGPVPPNPAEMIESKRMTEFFESVKAGYDTIVIDTPPVAFVTDALLLSKLIDLQLFVIRHEYSRKDLLQMINELYRNRGNQNMALVINDIKEGGISRYGYRYGYYYGYCNNGGYSQEVQENLLVGSQIIESLKKKFGRSLS
jgi:capsular exopolysaccharide synthesis family protein